MVKYVASQPPASLDPELQRYLSDEFNRIQLQQHLRWLQFNSGEDAGPHPIPIDPLDVLILSYTLPSDVTAGAQWFFETTIDNTGQQADTAYLLLEVVGTVPQAPEASIFVDATATGKLSTSGFSENPLPKGTVVNFYMRATKFANMTASNSTFLIVEG